MIIENNQPALMNDAQSKIEILAIIVMMLGVLGFSTYNL